VAEELGLTKQALIHHFGTKERLYAEVLARMAEGLASEMRRATAAAPDPLAQLEGLFLKVLTNAHEHFEDTLLLMREVLDNRPRAGHAHRWPLTDYLGSIVAIARRAPGAAGLSDIEALTRVYALFGAINYFAVSGPTLRNMYGEAGYAAMRAGYPGEVSRMVRDAFG
jgi:AcrR family transcriptional regulator